MVRIIPSGRTDTADLFTKNDIFTRKGDRQIPHTPFLVFRATNEAVAVVIVNRLRELLTYDDDTVVMSQWEGQYSSDFFQYTVGDVRRALAAR